MTGSGIYIIWAGKECYYVGKVSAGDDSPLLPNHPAAAMLNKGARLDFHPVNSNHEADQVHYVLVRALRPTHPCKSAINDPELYARLLRDYHTDVALVEGLLKSFPKEEKLTSGE